MFRLKFGFPWKINICEILRKLPAQQVYVEMYEIRVHEPFLHSNSSSKTNYIYFCNFLWKMQSTINSKEIEKFEKMKEWEADA